MTNDLSEDRGYPPSIFLGHSAIYPHSDRESLRGRLIFFSSVDNPFCLLIFPIVLSHSLALLQINSIHAMPFQTVGVLGGGQLGRMLVEAASRLNLPILTLDPSSNSPAKQISSASHLDGSFSDASMIQSLSEKVDVLTVEIEHVDASALKRIRDDNVNKGGKTGKGIKVYPSPETILTIQDKYNQKLHLVEKGLPVADFQAIEGDSSTLEEIERSIQSAVKAFGLPLMLKSRTQAYDGKGNFLLHSSSSSSISDAITALGRGSRPLYAERFAPFTAEIAVMVVKSGNGQVETYDPVETVHRDNICHLVRAPLRVGGRGTGERARKFAKEAVEAFGEGAVGIFGVEMFLLSDGEHYYYISLHSSNLVYYLETRSLLLPLFLLLIRTGS